MPLLLQCHHLASAGPEPCQAHWEGGGWFHCQPQPAAGSHCALLLFLTFIHQSIPYYCLCELGVPLGIPGENNCVHFLGCHKKHHGWGAETREIYSLGPRGQKSGIKVRWLGQAPPNAPGEDSLWPLPGSVLWPQDPNLCLRLLVSFSYKGIGYIRGPPNDLILDLFTCKDPISPQGPYVIPTGAGS